MNYRYAELRESGERWYLEFYAWNPEKAKLCRKRVYINRTRSLALRRRTAQRLGDHINHRLDTGWNPFITEDLHRQFISLKTALEFMLKFKGTYLRPRSMPNYRTGVSSLLEWLKKNYRREILSGEFSEKMAQEFMQHLLLEGKISARTFNGKLTDYRSFFNFLVQHKYCTSNPFKSVKALKQQEKSKLPFPHELQRRYADWCIENDYPFYIASMLCYYCGMRPVEIVGMKAGDLGENHLIRILPENGKGGKQRSAPVPDVFYRELIEFLADIEPGQYLFSKNLKPGVKKVAPTRIAERFAEIRKILNISPEITFYSLKDTSAENLDYAGFSTKALQLLYGHTSIKTTNEYMVNIGAKAYEDLIKKFPKFGQ